MFALYMSTNPSYDDHKCFVPFDNGQKWRAYKNIARAWKNPIGYMYWKTDVFAKNNRIRFMYLNLAYMLWHSVAITMMCKSTKTSMIAHWRYQTG